MVMDGLYRTAFRMTGDRTRSEDVVQETILKAYRFFGSYKEGTNFRAWIHRVLYTVFVNTIRDRSPRTAALDGIPEPEEKANSLIEELDRPTHIQRARAVLDAADDRIQQAVLELPQDLRMVFLLSTVEDLKYREIAEIVGCPLGTVMSRLFRSRRMLQDRLVEYAREKGLEVNPEAPGEDMRDGERK